MRPLSAPQWVRRSRRVPSSSRKRAGSSRSAWVNCNSVQPSMMSARSRNVSSPLTAVCAVVVSLILQRQFEVRIAEVESAEELSRRRIHASVHFGFGQPCEHDRHAEQRLARRLGPVGKQGQCSTEVADAAPRGIHGNGEFEGRSRGLRQPPRDQLVARRHEVREGEHRGEVAPGALGNGDREPESVVPVPDKECGLVPDDAFRIDCASGRRH
jgi:hypothetical protein